MRVVALISGGKDSCYNMMQCVSEGHDIVALANLYPEDKDELDSYMYQTVGHHAIDLYAEAMDLPLYRRIIQGSSREIGKYYSPTTDDEVEDLYELLKTVKNATDIEGVSSGAILSDYQRVRVENVCQRLGLTSLAYLWRRNQQELMREMIDCHVEAIIIKVAALGLDPKKHLGKTLAEMYPHMMKMDKDFGLHICGEGGEFETFTLDCPLFKKKLVVDETERVIHSEDAFAPVGYLNLKKIHLENKPVHNCSVKDFLHSLPMTRGCDLSTELFTEEEQEQLDKTVHPADHNSSVTVPDVHEDVHIQTHIGEKWFYVSGVMGKSNPGESVEDTTRRVMERLKDAVQRLGRTMADLVSVSLCVHNMSDFSRVNSVYKTYFSINPPIRVCVQTANPGNVSLLLDCQGHVSDDIKVKDTMHVQSISHWASCNIGPYSQAVHMNDRMCVAGQIGLCPASMKIIAGGIAAESRLSLRHVRRVLTAMHSGCSLSNITHMICYVTVGEHIQTARREWRAVLSSQQTETYGEELCAHEPSVQFVIVPRLPRDALVEWQVEAYTGSESLTDENVTITLANKSKISLDYCSTPSSSSSPVFSSRGTIVSIEKTMLVYQQSMKEMVRVYGQVLEKHSITGDSLHLWRIFYPAALVHYTQLNSVISETLEDLHGQTPVFSLIPVTDLSPADCILAICC